MSRATIAAHDGHELVFALLAPDAPRFGARHKGGVLPAESQELPRGAFGNRHRIAVDAQPSAAIHPRRTVKEDRRDRVEHFGRVANRSAFEFDQAAGRTPEVDRLPDNIRRKFPWMMPLVTEGRTMLDHLHVPPPSARIVVDAAQTIASCTATVNVSHPSSTANRWMKTRPTLSATMHGTR